MSNRIYTDQLREGLREARDKLIAARDLALGQMNAAQARLAQQSADSSDRAQARDDARARERVMRRGQYLTARLGHLGNAAAAAASASDAAAARLIQAVEDNGRSVRSLVEVKDRVLREVDGVAGIARNHLRVPAQSGSTGDPLSALASDVARTLATAGSAAEKLQQLAVTANIEAAQSLAAGALAQWRDAATSLDGVAKQAAAALADAAKEAAATLTSNEDLQKARYATWEQLNESDHASLACLQGLLEVDRVVNGNLTVGRHNDRTTRPGISASFQIVEPAPDPQAGSAAEKESPKPAPEVAFFVVPASSASAFSRNAARDALAAGYGRSIPGRRIQEASGALRWEFVTPSEEPLVQDVTGRNLVLGNAYTVYAAELEPKGRRASSGSRRTSTAEIARLSLGSPSITAAVGFTHVRPPQVHVLPGGAFVVRFDNVAVDLHRAGKVRPEDWVEEYRLLVMRNPVWQSWQGRLGGKRVASLPAEAAKSSPEARTSAAAAPATPGAKGAKSARDSKPGDEGVQEDLLEANLQKDLVVARQIRLAGMLNEADWTVLHPSGDGVVDSSAKPEVIAREIAAQYQADMKLVPHTASPELNERQVQEIAKALGGASPTGFALCYFSPYAQPPADAEDSPADSRSRRKARKNFLVARYTDIRGEVIDLGDIPYVALVHVVGKRSPTTGMTVAEDTISDASEPFQNASSSR